MAGEVEQEVCGATGTARFANETEQAFLGRVVKKLDNLPDSLWDKLSEPAKAWSATAALATNENRPIPWFTGEVKKDVVRCTAAQRIRELLVENNKLHSKDILKRLQEEGYECNYVSVQVECGHFRAALKFLAERGLLNMRLE